MRSETSALGVKYLIYIVAFLEWWTTLSVEIVAIRKFTPIIWSNSISTSVILWVILLALSYWYYIWWKISANKENLEKKLIYNLILSSLYYFFITFLFLEVILTNILSFSWDYFISILLSSIVLFFIPVFLASQTIPLLSELLKWNNSWEKMWKLLFFSTIGSFLWATSTSVVLFPLIWVFKTAVISPIILSLCAFVLSIFFLKNVKKLKIISWFLLLFYIYFNVTLDLWNNNIIFQKANSYHNIKIYDIENSTWKNRIFSLDWWYSSWIDLESRESFFEYIREVENKVVELKAKNILVIWAAGFTFPHDISKLDFVENIDVVDIDWDLKDIAEKYFLEEKLSSKINFYPEPSRFFINNIISTEGFYPQGAPRSPLNSKKYDLILVDAYSGKSLPPQVLTKEFFDNLEKIGENIFLNIIIDRDLKSIFSKNLLTTLDSSFSEVYYKDVNIWLSDYTNMIISNKKSEKYIKNKTNFWEIYKDDKNSIELDLYKMQIKRAIKN